MNIVRKLMDADEFLAWRQDQPGRWELVSGTPIQAMAGAKQRHDRIVVNLIVQLGQRLRGKPCRPWTADIATRIPEGNVRQPDVTIDCGPVRDDALDAAAPTIVFEVLSPSTRAIDLVKKLDEYKRVPSFRGIVLIDPDRVRLLHWQRGNEAVAWADAELTELRDALELKAVGVSLSLGEIHEDVRFEAEA